MVPSITPQDQEMSEWTYDPMVPRAPRAPTAPSVPQENTQNEPQPDYDEEYAPLVPYILRFPSVAMALSASRATRAPTAPSVPQVNTQNDPQLDYDDKPPEYQPPPAYDDISK